MQGREDTKMGELVRHGFSNGQSGRSSVRIAGVMLLVGALAAVGIYLGVAGGSTASASAAPEDEPAVIEEVGGKTYITLSASAIKRLDIKTAPVRNVAVEGQQRKAVPYGAVFYDPDGKTWVYASSKPRKFVRASITVDSIDGNRVLLSAGPAAGVLVATVGVQQLFGSEIEYSG
jgi:hypothetical protein